MGIIQNEIKSLHVFSGEKAEYISKYKEIIMALINSDDIYTVMSKRTTYKEFHNKTGKIFCGINEEKDPCIWLFSQQSYAMAYAEHFNFKLNNYHLVRKVSRLELTESLFNAMFKGVKTIRVDEGQTILNISIFDFVNSLFEAEGRDPIIKEQDKPFINFLNEFKLKGKTVYLYKGKKLEDKESWDINSVNFLPYNEEGTIKIYTSEDRAKQSEIVDSAALLSVPFISFSKIINACGEDESIENIDLINGDKTISMNIKKAIMILNKMN